MHREYTRNLVEGQEKLHDAAPPYQGAIGTPPATLQHQGNGRSPWVT